MNKELTLYFTNGDVVTYTEGGNCIKITDSRERDLAVVKVRFEDRVMEVYKGVPFKIRLVESEKPEGDEFSDYQSDNLRPAKRPGYFR